MDVDRACGLWPNAFACKIIEMRTLLSGAGQIVKITHRNREEIAALRLMREIFDHGSDARDRTGVGTKHLFARTLEFNLAGGSFPLFTSKRTWLLGLFEELMLYCRGQTNSKILEEKKINVWQPNTTRDFLDRRGLNNLPEGDMGASYGFQMRHYGAEYKDCNTNYAGQGFDQLHALIANIRACHSGSNHSAARRLIINLWNPAQEHLMALPPCLYQYQFFIDGNELSCMATQRSSDVATALGWNIAQISLLTILIAKTCDLRPKKITWVCGDAHIYANLQNQALEQLAHEPFLFPVLELAQKRENIEDYQFADLRLFNYNCFPPIKGVMNV
jgi:thymidylate synthase